MDPVEFANALEGSNGGVTDHVLHHAALHPSGQPLKGGSTPARMSRLLVRSYRAETTSTKGMS
jgi:hypothetical protein